MNIENKEKRFKFKGAEYTFDTFTKQHAGGDESVSEAMLAVLESKSMIVFIDSEIKTKQDLAVEKALKELGIVQAGDEIDAIKENNKDYEHYKKSENRLKYEQAEYDFADIYKAQEFELYAQKETRLSTSIMTKNNIHTVFVYELTDMDLTKLNRKYKLENTVDKTIDVSTDVAMMASKGVDYASKKVLAPVVQVVARSGASILKTSLSALVKTGSTLISSTYQGVKEASHEISNDAQFKIASRDLVHLKDDLRKATNSVVTSVSAGSLSNGGGRVTR